jgi:hypothetical protein
MRSFARRVEVGRAEENGDALRAGVEGGVDVGVAGASDHLDHRRGGVLHDEPHRGRLLLGHGREAGLDERHPEACEGAGDGALAIGREGEPGSLLPVAQGGVGEDEDRRRLLPRRRRGGRRPIRDPGAGTAGGPCATRVAPVPRHEAGDEGVHADEVRRGAADLDPTREVCVTRAHRAVEEHRPERAAGRRDAHVRFRARIRLAAAPVASSDDAPPRAEADDHVRLPERDLHIGVPWRPGRGVREDGEHAVDMRVHLGGGDAILRGCAGAPGRAARDYSELVPVAEDPLGQDGDDDAAGDEDQHGRRRPRRQDDGSGEQHARHHQQAVRPVRGRAVGPPEHRHQPRRRERRRGDQARGRGDEPDRPTRPGEHGDHDPGARVRDDERADRDARGDVGPVHGRESPPPGASVPLGVADRADEVGAGVMQHVDEGDGQELRHRPGQHEHHPEGERQPRHASARDVAGQPPGLERPTVCDTQGESDDDHQREPRIEEHRDHAARGRAEDEPREGVGGGEPSGRDRPVRLGARVELPVEPVAAVQPRDPAERRHSPRRLEPVGCHGGAGKDRARQADEADV